MIPEPKLGTIDGPCCAHLKIVWMTTQASGVTTGWWACEDCLMKFCPVIGEVGGAAIRARMAAMKAALVKIYSDIPARPNMTEAGRVALMAETALAAICATEIINE